MENTIGFTGSILVLAVANLSAATLYVSLESTNPTPPYATWATAATNIQDAVDWAAAGDEVVVTNGVYYAAAYYTGGVAVTNPLALLSLNGPQFTVINGGEPCVSLTDGASLTGFTLTNGVYGGGVSCTSTNAFLTNCVITGNSGGGASGGTLYNCTLTGNSALPDMYGDDGCGGGAFDCTLYNCIVYFNTASAGTNYDTSSTLNYCCTTPLPTNAVGNIAVDPQLASASYLSADSPCRGAGSAAYASGSDIDGEAWGNPPSIGCDEYHAGALTGPLTVTLLAIYTNVAVGYPVSLTALIEGRTTDSVWDFGDGDVAINEPYVSHRWTEAGDYLVALWAFNESLPGGVSTTVTIHVVAHPVYYVAATSTNPQPPYAEWATAATDIQDAVDAAAVGGTVLVSNGVYATGGWAGSGTMTTRVVVYNPLTLLSVNGPQFTVINGGGTNQCVSLTDGASLSGFTLTNGFAGSGGGVSCTSTNAFLTNCVITGNSASSSFGDWGGGGANGGTLYNCTLTSNSANNGSGGAYRSTLYNCTLTNNSGGGADGCTLYNCTVTGNSGQYDGGGASGCSLYNCALTGNSATDGYGGAVSSCTLYNCTLTGNSASSGGAAYGALLYNCTVTGNSAQYAGGGANDSTLYNCTVTGNSAQSYGGGASGCTLYNCIVYFNTASGGGANYDSYNTLNYCCTAPLPTSGVGNFTNAPLFVGYANGNLRLQANSPCINSGNNAYVTTATDLDGNQRIVSGTADIGAYEYQGAGSVISYAWLQQYHLPTDGSADYADPDHDGMNNWQEWICGTNPTNALSALKMTAATPTNNPPGTVVTWESVSGIIYTLQRSSNLAAQPAFSLIQTNIVGQAGTTSCTDTNATGAGPFFYRVGVKWP